MRQALYQTKIWLKQIFLYPQDRIVSKDSDYDLYWEDKRGSNIGSLSDWQKDRADILLKKLPNNTHASFLDIGCGDGSVLNYLKEHGVISNATGIDVSSVALERVKKFGFESIQADITNLSFLNNIPSSDYTILFEILEHVQHSEEMLKHAYDKASKGVFFSFPNSGFFVYRLRLLFGKFPAQWRLFPGEHVRFWTTHDLRWWLKVLGYEDYQISYYKGLPILNKIWPSLFAAAFVVYLEK